MIQQLANNSQRDDGLCVGGNITAAGNSCCPPLVCGSDRVSIS